jgi:hypothetical protein
MQILAHLKLVGLRNASTPRESLVDLIVPDNLHETVRAPTHEGYRYSRGRKGPIVHRLVDVPNVDAALRDLETQNPLLCFRVGIVGGAVWRGIFSASGHSRGTVARRSPIEPSDSVAEALGSGKKKDFLQGEVLSP